jgi:hypothetical protein
MVNVARDDPQPSPYRRRYGDEEALVAFNISLTGCFPWNAFSGES